MTKNIGHLLMQIRSSDRFEPRANPAETDERQRPTSFGAPLSRCGENCYRVDMSAVLVLSGVSEWSAQLAERFREVYRSQDTDQLILQTVSSSATPELAALGIRQVAIAARRPVAAVLAQETTFLGKELRRVFGALQSLTLRQELFAPPDAETAARCRARLFPFGQTAAIPEGFVLLEYEPDGSFMRLTFEFSADNRLHLKRIAHRVISEQQSAFYTQDVDALADVMALDLQQAVRNQREYHAETPDRQADIFQTLHSLGLSAINQIRFTWPQQQMAQWLHNRDPELRRLIARALLLLKEESAATLLAESSEIELVYGKKRLYLDISRRQTCLNLAFVKRRRQVQLNDFLARQPSLARAAADAAGSLHNIRVLFVHHFTAETLGFIEAMRQLNCAHLHGLFIRYKGGLPDAYLEAILSLPESQFTFHSLSQIEHADNLTGRYLLAQEFSPIATLAPLAETLRQTPADYFAAMRMSCCYCLMQQLLEAAHGAQHVLLVEDGGYAAPIFNQWTAENISLHEAIRRCHMDLDALRQQGILPPDIPLAEWLPRYLIANIEHTRNGYDQLMQVRRQYGRPSYPSYTIALSDYKNSAEALGAALSILMAIEYIMSGHGGSLYHRRSLVIGSRGFIGRHLLSQLAARNGAETTIGVDLTAAGGASARLPLEYPDLDSIPRAQFATLDLIIGITGKPVLKAADVEYILLNGSSHRLTLASGSTKNVELAAVTDWLQTLRHRESAQIGGYSVKLETMPLRDPITDAAQGSIVRIHFDGDALPPGITAAAPFKDIVLAADGMPINFNFFGVPGEIMDRVMQQLLSLCIIAVQHRCNPPPPDIYALDYNLDATGQLTQDRQLP